MLFCLHTEGTNRHTQSNTTNMSVIQKQDFVCKVSLPEMESYIVMFDHPENKLKVQTDGTVEGTSVKIYRGDEFKIDIDKVHLSVNPDAERELKELVKQHKDCENIIFMAYYDFSECKEIWQLSPGGVFEYEFGMEGVRTNYVIKSK